MYEKFFRYLSILVYQIFINAMIIKKDYSLKHLNTFGIDVKSKLYAEVFSPEEIHELFKQPGIKLMEKFILGGGSNILFTNDFPGLVIKISISGIKIIKEENDYVEVEAGAGVIWNDLVKFCIENNFGGIENLSLIPGTVGAAPIQNIGAYGQELKDAFISLRGISINEVSEKDFKKEDCKFGYRDSVFKNKFKDKFIITFVKLRLKKNPSVNLSYKSVYEEVVRLGLNNPTIKDVSGIIIKIRKSKLPDPVNIGNAGSFFKNPEVDNEKYKELKKLFDNMPGHAIEDKVKIPAAWLIENCGWKGRRLGNAGVHEKQPLVIVNYGNASGKEILKLSSQIKNSVFDKFGIKLNEEVNVI